MNLHSGSTGGPLNFGASYFTAWFNNRFFLILFLVGKSLVPGRKITGAKTADTQAVIMKSFNIRRQQC
jgi:hypothetical protein